MQNTKENGELEKVIMKMEKEAEELGNQFLGRVLDQHRRKREEKDYSGTEFR